MKRRWRDLWAATDPLLVHAGPASELLVARTRIAVVSVLLAVAVAAVLVYQRRAAVAEALLLLAALALAVIIHGLIRSRFYRPWFGAATSALDVSLVTIALAVPLIGDGPAPPVAGRVAFGVYFLAIAATALRYDARTSTLTGLLAAAEYAGVAAWADWPVTAPAEYGRMALLVCAGLISTVVVWRAQTLRRLSASDPLTALMNRGYFDERMVEEEIRAKRYHRPLAIAMIDIDHFKEFNDTYGHVSGDEALATVASAIRKSVRRTDLVARYGGEEFVIAFPETAPAVAVRKGEDIRRAVQETGVILRGSRGVARVAVSVGVAGWPDDALDLATVMERADQRLYQAKQMGRNQVIGPTGV
jgi:diguanylate cyclase (GGDEF)-like protein